MILPYEWPLEERTEGHRFLVAESMRFAHKLTYIPNHTEHMEFTWVRRRMGTSTGGEDGFTIWEIQRYYMAVPITHLLSVSLSHSPVRASPGGSRATSRSRSPHTALLSLLCLTLLCSTHSEPKGCNTM